MDHNKTVPNTFARSLGLRGFFILSLWPLLAPVNCLAAAMSGIRLSADQSRFVLDKDNSTFIPWGFNYDHDRDGRLLEDYWQSEWPTVEEDFREIKQLGANVVRVHLQLGKFMSEPNRPNPAALERLGRLIELAEGTGLYLDITGLGCYHKKDVPAWYDALSEAKRWQVQARFWQAVAETAA
ncbi:MAG: hypothetical protein JW810_01990, partial [Sedimentisphaerales bacterium]|nr:hypothetical protein [Sedimentisphaerales bacterium]